jgi:RNA polymerase sigma-70 factor (ECF subfamily)
MLGSVQDAEDLLQETLLAAWRGLERFDGRSSLQVWLYRIATNRCRNALRDKGRRPRRVEPLAEPPEPTRRGEPIWLEPNPDALLGAAADTSPGPEARYELRRTPEPVAHLVHDRLDPNGLLPRRQRRQGGSTSCPTGHRPV